MLMLPALRPRSPSLPPSAAEWREWHSRTSKMPITRPMRHHHLMESSAATLPSSAPCLSSHPRRFPHTPNLWHFSHSPEKRGMPPGSCRGRGKTLPPLGPWAASKFPWGPQMLGAASLLSGWLVLQRTSLQVPHRAVCLANGIQEEGYTEEGWKSQPSLRK